MVDACSTTGGIADIIVVMTLTDAIAAVEDAAWWCPWCGGRLVRALGWCDTCAADRYALRECERGFHA